jgi:putative transposase
MEQTYRISQRRACWLLGLARSTRRYCAHPSRHNEELRRRLRELSEQRPRFGSPRLHALLRREGWVVNHKRTERIYRQEGLTLKRRRRRRLMRIGTGPQEGPHRGNQRWSLDFVSDAAANGQTIRVLAVVDDYTRECLATEVDTSLPGLRVVRTLDRLLAERGRPQGIVLDNGPELRGRAMEAWSEQNRVALLFIQPGKPVQNAFIESFNSRLRDECLNAHWFLTVADARRQIQAWRTDYNESRPHSSLGYLTPREFAVKTAAQTRASE